MTLVKPRGVQSLASAILACDWLDEPLLQFGNDGEHEDPTVGIPLYGPWSIGTARHKAQVHVGFIGTGAGIEKATRFYEMSSKGVDGDENNAPFCGCTLEHGFRMALVMGEPLNEKITQGELSEVLNIRTQGERFEAMLSLLLDKLRLLCERDQPLDYVTLVLPHELRKRCGTADYHIKGLGMVHRDLRRAFKARAMGYKTPTQLIMEETLSEVERTRDLDHIAKRAWNLFTGLYFKIDGLPWGPSRQVAATCNVGISFFRPLGSSSTLRTSLAQAFDENGEGLILRGHSFEWDEEKEGRSPHLTEELAGALIELVLQKYKEVRRQLPRRIVVHKSSRYDWAEREGFQAALRKVDQYDLISLNQRSDVRLIRAGKYPPLRGTSFRAGDVTYLYTTGYLPSIGAFQQGHVPSPLELTDHVGDTPHPQLMREILALTKMNWNSARMYGQMPITLRFSRLVGDILREFPVGEGQPSPKYKHYM